MLEYVYMENIPSIDASKDNTNEQEKTVGFLETAMKGYIGLWGFALKTYVMTDELEKFKKFFKHDESRAQIKNETGSRIPDDTLCFVLHIENSEVIVPAGSMLSVGRLSNSVIKKERGAKVSVLSTDEKSQIIEILGPEKLSNCQNCGAPLQGKSICEYCGTHY